MKHKISPEAIKREAKKISELVDYADGTYAVIKIVDLQNLIDSMTTGTDTDPRLTMLNDIEDWMDEHLYANSYGDWALSPNAEPYDLLLELRTKIKQEAGGD
jgi:hypothetical protein